VRERMIAARSRRGLSVLSALAWVNPGVCRLIVLAAYT
jgi:hypothetical protein